MARRAVAQPGVGIRLACECFAVSESGYRYTGKANAENALIADWWCRPTAAHERWGFGLRFSYPRNVEGFGWNHERACRIYRELELNPRIEPRHRRQRERPLVLGTATAVNRTGAMGFMSDSLGDGRTLRTFNVLDDHDREGLGIEVDLSLGGERVVRVVRVVSSLERIVGWRARPDAIRCDNGPEYLSQALRQRAEKHRITLLYIQPGKPTQNAYVERFDRTVRHEWLDLHDFGSVEHAQSLATERLWTCNDERPNAAIGGVPAHW